MKSLRPWKTYVVALVLLPFAVAACDSSENEAAPAEELGAMFTNLQSALSIALTAGFGKATAPDIKQNCPQGGTVDVTNNGSGGTLNASLTFSDCNGIDGNLTMRGSSSFSGQTFSYNLKLDGNLEERCTVSYNNFGYDITTNIQNANGASVLLNGSIDADCNGGSVTCTFNSVELDASNSASAFENACR